jgi:hypothetical protein
MTLNFLRKLIHKMNEILINFVYKNLNCINQLFIIHPVFLRIKTNFLINEFE